MKNTPSGYHLVHIAFDNCLHENFSDSDVADEQLAHARDLLETSPESHLTVILLTTNPDRKPFEKGNIKFIPLKMSSFSLMPALYKSLKRIHRSHPIDIISTSTIHEDAWMSLLFGKLNAIPVVGAVNYDICSPELIRKNLGAGPAGWLKEHIVFYLLPRFFALRAASAGVREQLIKKRIHTNIYSSSIDDKNPDSVSQEVPKKYVTFLIDTIQSNQLPPVSPCIKPWRHPTLHRWHKLATKQTSLLRGLQNEYIEQIKLKGKTLDIGGGKYYGYYHLLSIDGTVESVNISPYFHPTFIADLNKPLPLASNSYDNIISFNTFEHLSSDTLAISEMLRVLKPEGNFYIMVPFLYKIHGAPYDYHRHTAEWWIDYLKSCGVKEADIAVYPLVWDKYSSAYSLLEFESYWFRWFIKRCVLLIGVILDSLAAIEVQKHSDFAIGYFIKGTK